MILLAHFEIGCFPRVGLFCFAYLIIDKVLLTPGELPGQIILRSPLVSIVQKAERMGLRTICGFSLVRM